jgi:hypothetical protein
MVTPMFFVVQRNTQTRPKNQPVFQAGYLRGACFSLKHRFFFIKVHQSPDHFSTRQANQAGGLGLDFLLILNIIE